jgi:DNA-directed RNA polymerase specialized sigma subunit
MQHQKELKSLDEILKVLKELSEKDRTVLGLYLYERLSSKEVKTILEENSIEIKNPEYSH